ncbi:cuticle protein AM1199-like isoform X2 [Homarus americanus]|uniref:cuticle protein AM1199-like isoform X1 n=1 Tax=Homarus americanus TaxID=6706 RepID=UPI001C450901|nr:cuticle protein AM1199-like isoform X1 [Homarus americanus]XP_042241692.1 cuticle protein AM1199-like isoform X2 [Homarus americanus]
MKLVVLACLAAVAVAAPQFGRQFAPETRPDYRHIAIIRDNRQDNGDGNFNYDFETENGIIMNAVGTPGSKGQSNIQGSYRFPLPDGTVAEVRYVADENGYVAESPLIPTPHPLPAHAIEQIRIAEEQRAQGIVWDQYGFRVNRK